MCLLFHKNNRIRVATKDIVVYKLIQHNVGFNGISFLSSPFMGMKWSLNELHETEITILPEVSSSFDNYDRINAEKKWGKENIWSAKKGFHSSKTKKRISEYASIYGNTRVNKAIIPKGAKYITGIDGLMVSDQLILIGEAE